MPGSARRPQSLKPLRPISWWIVALAVLVIGLATWGIYEWLSTAAEGVTDKGERARLRVDIIRNALTVGAGLGGLAALILAFRRQKATELDSAMIAHDATERRITELRNQAVEQLGSENSAVRIGGLHNLERLGVQYAELRQVVLDEICAYLRRPAPATSAGSSQLRLDEGILKILEAAGDSNDVHLEKDVRRTAQLILQRHLIADSDAYWKHDRIDLTGAHLVAARFGDCELHNAEFNDAELHGDTVFSNAVFYGDMAFANVTFHGYANFANAKFFGNTALVNVIFSGPAYFRQAAFAGYADYANSLFHDDAGFEDATFHGSADFTEATVYGSADYTNATIYSFVDYTNATFHGSARFKDPVHKQQCVFAGARATLKPPHKHHMPVGWTLEPDSDDLTMGVFRSAREDTLEAETSIDEPLLTRQ